MLRKISYKNLNLTKINNFFTIFRYVPGEFQSYKPLNLLSVGVMSSYVFDPYDVIVVTVIGVYERKEMKKSKAMRLACSV